MNLTATFILGIVLLIALFDVFIITKKGKSESISAHIIRGSKQYPLIVLLFGVVLGHLFWSMPTESVYKDVKCEKTGE